MKKTFKTILHLVFTASALSAASWNLDAETREKIHKQIDEKHNERVAVCSSKQTDYFVDKMTHSTNFRDSDCRLCAKNDRGLELEKRIQIAGFYKIDARGSVSGHCVGTAALFVKYVLKCGLDPATSCSRLIEKIFPEGRYFDEAHLLSVNQPTAYIELPPTYLPSDPIPKDLIMDRIWFHQSAMDRFFQIYLEKSPQNYFSILPGRTNPAEFDSAAIYATLQQLPRKIFLIAYTHNSNNHCIAVSTDPNKLLVFDPSDGLYEFANLETLSKVSGNVLAGSHLRWVAAFDFPENTQ